MKFFPIVFSLFAAGALSKNGETPKSQLRLPDGPTCKSVGKGANGLEQFEDPDGCCLLPIRCGNEAGERCERVGDSPTTVPAGPPTEVSISAKAPTEVPTALSLALPVVGSGMVA
ncbi:hypothetical protein PG988_011241 [Apiospora saccharicola]